MAVLSEDLFWRAVFKTAGYVVLQAGLMVIISLITALVLNRNIKALGFFRSEYFTLQVGLNSFQGELNA